MTRILLRCTKTHLCIAKFCKNNVGETSSPHGPSLRAHEKRMFEKCEGPKHFFTFFNLTINHKCFSIVSAC